MLILRHVSAVLHLSTVFKIVVNTAFGLAIHPDKIRIATGQIAGVDKDGRVSGTVLCILYQVILILGWN